MADQFQQGSFIQADFFDNTKGLNFTDSPIRVLDGQATQGYNFEYNIMGGFRKRLGHNLINSVADGQTRHLGTGVLIDLSNNKTVIRAAGNKYQKVDTVAGTITDLSEDTAAAGTTSLPNSLTQPILFQQMNGGSGSTLWSAGPGTTSICGIYSGSKFTKNGVTAPAGSISSSVGGTGGTIPTGTYYYAVAYVKSSTGAVSNAALDISVSVTLGQQVTINLAGLTGLDTTQISNIRIYRSAISGVSAFTSGDLAGTVASTASTFVDSGTVQGTAANVPRAGNTVLDNSTLAVTSGVSSGPWNALALWKRRLVTANQSTVYYSDLNKPESWPRTNTITIPSGGPITGLAVISFTTPTSATLDELLVVFKDYEVWVITGTDYTDVSLKYIDRAGCINQALCVLANGFLFWMDYRGIYMWDGSGKPAYLSRPIEYQFSSDGTLDKSKLNLAWGAFHKKTSQIIWYLSDSVIGEQQYGIKLDLRLTIPMLQTNVLNRQIEGVFSQDKTTFPLYGGASVFPTTDELLVAGDASGYTYSLNYGTADNSGGINFTYDTKILDLGRPGQSKRLNKVIVWVEDTSDASLSLTIWNNYHVQEQDGVTFSQPISKQVSRAEWDLAYWDAFDWDSYNRTYTPLVFEVPGIEGEAFKLRFSQTDANVPVGIAGFSLIYSPSGLRLSGT